MRERERCGQTTTGKKRDRLREKERGRKEEEKREREIIIMTMRVRKNRKTKKKSLLFSSLFFYFPPLFNSLTPFLFLLFSSLSRFLFSTSLHFSFLCFISHFSFLSHLFQDILCGMQSLKELSLKINIESNGHLSKADTFLDSREPSSLPSMASASNFN